MTSAYLALQEAIDRLQIIDTHEHLPAFERDRHDTGDVLSEYLIQYFWRDLISAGMPKAEYQRLISRDMPLMAKWEVLEPYWKLCRLTGYGQALDIAARGLYGVKGIKRQNIEEMNEAFLKHRDGQHYQRVLKEKSGIRISLLDISFVNQHLDCDRRYFRPVFRMERFLEPRRFDDIETVERETGIPVRSFPDWLDACEAQIDLNMAQGAVAMKSAFAYERALRYDRVPFHEAEQCFNCFFDSAHIPDWKERSVSGSLAYQNYMMRHILRLLERKGIPLQLHTGMQDGHGNMLSNANPVLLSNLFIQYPGLQFILMHMAYPYWQELCVLVKNCPNVAMDMCWGFQVSPMAAKAVLRQALELVPINKICAYGGDSAFIDAVYGSQRQTRRVVGEVLYDMMDAGKLEGQEEALALAEMLLYQNPYRLFGLERHLREETILV